MQRHRQFAMPTIRNVTHRVDRSLSNKGRHQSMQPEAVRWPYPGVLRGRSNLDWDRNTRVSGRAIWTQSGVVRWPWCRCAPGWERSEPGTVTRGLLVEDNTASPSITTTHLIILKDCAGIDGTTSMTTGIKRPGYSGREERRRDRRAEGRRRRIDR